MGSYAILRSVLAVAIGLLLGSVLPADILARRRGVDIRSVGDGNPGTVNAFRSLGWKAGVVTLVYDALVGICAIAIAGLIGTSPGVAYLTGVMTIVGHRFPLYLGFRGGGQGMATSAGMLVYGVGVSLANGWLSLSALAVVVGIIAVTLMLTRSGVAVALVMLPVLFAALLLAPSGWQFLAFMAAVCGNIWMTQLGVARTRPVFRIVWLSHGQTRG